MPWIFDDLFVHGTADVDPVVGFDDVFDHVFALNRICILEMVHGIDVKTVGWLAEQIVEGFHVHLFLGDWDEPVRLYFFDVFFAELVESILCCNDNVLLR